MNCRHCGAELSLTMVDLGTAPPSNAYLKKEDLQRPEQWFPLRVLVCSRCWLVQTEDFLQAERLFSPEYAYFSSYSNTWLAHCRTFVNSIVERLKLGAEHFVVEVAANDGYLLQYVRARGIPCLGIEPTASTASVARARGIEIVQDFFGTRLAEELASRGLQADLLIANNVLAHVPDLNDFVQGLQILLKPEGLVTLEFQHLLSLVSLVQFDTIYHEHFSYLSLGVVDRVFSAAGLEVFDVEKLPTHGGSLRVYAQRKDSARFPRTKRVAEVIEEERRAGLFEAETYRRFQTSVDKIKNDFLRFLLEARSNDQVIAGYGAAAKANTLLNYAGVRRDLVAFVADRNPSKQGKYLPGSRIPIVPEESLKQTRPAYVIVFPWNLRDEILSQLAYIRNWGGRFVVAVPKLEFLP